MKTCHRQTWSRRRSGEKSWFGPTHAVSLWWIITRTQCVLSLLVLCMFDVSWRIGISTAAIAPYLAFLDNMESGSGGDEALRCIHPHPCAVSSPLAKVSAQFGERCAWGQIRTKVSVSERGRQRGQSGGHPSRRGKVLFGQIEQHQRLYPFHITEAINFLFSAWVLYRYS
jgi:hypothetical protein